MCDSGYTIVSDLVPTILVFRTLLVLRVTGLILKALPPYRKFTLKCIQLLFIYSEYKYVLILT